jgi:hypothetical protein
LIVLNQWLVTGDSMRAEGCQVGDRLNEVGFALAVETYEEVYPGVEFEIGSGVVPKMRKGEVSN